MKTTISYIEYNKNMIYVRIIIKVHLLTIVLYEYAKSSWIRRNSWLGSLTFVAVGIDGAKSEL